MMFAMMRTGAIAPNSATAAGLRTRASKSSAAASASPRPLLTHTRRAAMRVTSAHRGIAPRGRAVVRRAAESSRESADVADAETSPEDKAAIELAAILDPSPPSARR